MSDEDIGSGRGNAGDDGSDERRVHARIQVTRDLSVLAETGIVAAELRNISRGGAFLETSEPIGCVGETVELLVPDDEGEEITVMCEVVRKA